MVLRMHSWESRLLDWAQEGYETSRYGESLLDETETYVRPAILHRAYQRCEQVTREHSRTFFLASNLLPAEKRLAIRALYAFCRVSDDLVDRAVEDAAAKLSDWKEQALQQINHTENLILLAWNDTRLRFRVPWRYAEQLLEGIACDLQKTRYETFDELASYSYRVASTVGLMSMHIIGYHSKDAIPYAVKLGVALQLTNILRDVGEDWINGRLYLPLDDLARFGITEQDIEEKRMDNRWKDFMRFQIERTRQLYAEAMPGIRLLHPDGRFAIAAAAELYQGILDDIERHDYDVFHRRAHLSSLQKIIRLPGIWFRL